MSLFTWRPSRDVDRAITLLAATLFGVYLAISAPGDLMGVHLVWFLVGCGATLLLYWRITAPRCERSAWAWLAGALLVSGYTPLYWLAADHEALAPYVRWFVLAVAGLFVVALHRWPATAAALDDQAPRAQRWLRRLLAGYLLVTAGLAAYRWHILTLGNVDSAIVIQSLRYTLDHGRILYNTLEKVSHLGVHNSPIYLLLAPLYGLFRRPDWFLILLPPVAITLSAWPLYRLLARKVGDMPALLLTAAYLLYPAIMARSVGDLYEMTLCPALLLAALDAYDQERLSRFLLWSVLCLAVKESIGATFLAMGLYGLLTKREGWRIWLPAILGLAAIYISYGVVLPALGGDAVSSRTAALLGELGATPGEALRFALTQPIQFARVVLTLPRLALFYQLLQGLAFVLPLLGAEMVMALPAVAINLLAQGGSIGIRGWEASILGPLFFLSAASGIAWLSQRLARPYPVGIQRAKARMDLDETRLLLAFTVFFATLVCTPFWLRTADYQPAPHLAAQRTALALIPTEAAVSAPDTMMAHLAERDILQLQTGQPFWAAYHLVDTHWIEAMRGRRIPEAAALEYEALIQGTSEGRLYANLRRIWAQDGIYLFENTEH